MSTRTHNLIWFIGLWVLGFVGVTGTGLVIKELMSLITA